MNCKKAKRKRITIILLLAGIVSIAAVAAGVIYAGRDIPVWLVEEKFAEPWQAFLKDSGRSPLGRTVGIYREGEEPPKSRYGYIIAGKLPGEGSGGEGDRMVKLYPGLANTREYNGALVLAFDPWVMVNEFTDPGLDRARLRGGANTEGLLIAPGGEPGARLAWLGQLLQKEPAVWAEGRDYWTAQGDLLFRSALFQRGAFTYNWNNAWELFFKNKPAWIYTPYSLAQGQPIFQSAGLTASRFPEPESWDSYGVQADLLWALPFGTVQDRDAKLAAAKAWLQKGETQTVLANKLRWIPAVPGGRPYNSLAQSAQLVWNRSAYIWTY
jgi:hypothetical protein